MRTGASTNNPFSLAYRFSSMVEQQIDDYLFPPGPITMPEPTHYSPMTEAAPVSSRRCLMSRKSRPMHQSYEAHSRPLFVPPSVTVTITAYSSSPVILYNPTAVEAKAPVQE